MMRRKLFKNLLLILFIAVLAAGCSKSVEIEETSDGEDEILTGQSEQTDRIRVESTEQQSEENSSAQQQSEENKSTEQQSAEQKSSAEDNRAEDRVEEQEVVSVIVKSENNLSDSEKQVIINQLSQEVDELLIEINSVE